MSGYADYCPIAKGVDVLGDRWTPLVIRELMVGATGFNEIHRGIPRVSRTLLAQRLRHLERLGLVERESDGPGRPSRYYLTEPGQALTPIVWAMGHWAAEWMFGDPEDEDCDGRSVMWRMHQHVDPAKLPTQRTVVHVVLTGREDSEGWLVLDSDGVTLCTEDQGHDVDLVIEADIAQMQRWLVGRTSFRALISEGHARLLGPSRLIRAFPGWFPASRFAPDARRAERRVPRQADAELVPVG